MGRIPFGDGFTGTSIITCFPWSLATHCQLSVQNLKDMEIVTKYVTVYVSIVILVKNRKFRPI